ncbi:MAG: TetR family transcriptional regulator [Bacteroidetes bacterium]|jgi:AcrR family transcriptional regulator|nr:TetR family transcriptional regulator [Bacteroidota bacterium]|tara:strand:- start:1543 stop:2115 length:573 start_codon:yes stop_codon:yes gene_type:complete
MPRTEEQFEEIRESKKKQIMDSALELFANKGFASTSINMIAIHAGISKGLIYNYFESKEELITTIIHNGFDEFLDIFDSNKDGVLTEEEFVFFINETFEILKNNLQFWRLYFFVVAQPDVLKLVEKKLMDIIMPLITTMSKYFEAKGFENPMAYARFFGAVLDGVTMNYMMDSETFPLEDIKKIIINKFI